MARMSPTVTIVIPTYNEERNLRTCLDAIVRQDYPLALIQVVMVDNRSTDNTIGIIERYMSAHSNISLMFNDVAKDAEISKMIGLRAAQGDLFLYLDADIEVVGNRWLSTLVGPLNEDPSLVGAFPRFVPNKNDSMVGRFLRYHPLELDPVLDFFCTTINETVVAEEAGYWKCEFHPPRVPPIGICLYRTAILRSVIAGMQRFMDKRDRPNPFMSVTISFRYGRLCCEIVVLV